MGIKVAVTGAAGFVGSEICRLLLKKSYAVRGIVRSLDSVCPINGVEYVGIGNIHSTTDWSSALAGVNCVIHCAAKVNIVNEFDKGMVSELREVNVAGTKRLSEEAASLGVKRLVYLSSIKVNGEKTGFDAPFSSVDVPRPKCAYSISKWEAEQTLLRLATKTSLEVVVVRSPLIYGPGVKGNMARFLKLVRAGIPLPFGALKNRRSLIGLTNICDLLIRCVEHPDAPQHTFLVSDGEDVSTPDLFRCIAAASGCSALLLPMPKSMLRLVGYMLGKQAEIERLVGSLQIDTAYAREVLDWTPPLSFIEGIREMVRN